MTAAAAAANCSKTAAATTITMAAELTTATILCAGVYAGVCVCVRECGRANKTKNALQVAFATGEIGTEPSK